MGKNEKYYEKRIVSLLIFLAVLCFIFLFFDVRLNGNITKLCKQSEDEFRAMELDQTQIAWFQTHGRKGKGRWLKQYSAIVQDMKQFPVKKDVENRIGWNYENSWKEDRIYGGKRFHEGTDIIADNNERGYFTVVSVSDGIVEKKGWLEKGGWRIGIRSPQGVYFYYAHLCEYAEGIEEGVSVKAGDVIGTMGDSGYSPVEGTVGNFCVHLHFGIYLDIDGKETSVNPYRLLKSIEKNP